MSNNCKIPTPREYVEKLLDSVEYTHNLYGKRFLENSCGEGAILIEAIRRYIECSIQEGKNKSEIAEGLAKDFVAYETDRDSIVVCTKNLNQLTVEFGLPEVSWNIRCEDYLKQGSGKFDFIVSNPPYVTYHDLAKEVREELRKSFNACKSGRFDYYYAFIEKSLKELDLQGRMAFIVPFGIARNKFAKRLREDINCYLTDIFNYEGVKVFPGVLTSSIVFSCREDCDVNEPVKYHRCQSNDVKNMDRKEIKAEWIFTDGDLGEARFGDFFKVRNAVATLYNEAYIISPDEEDEDFYYCSNGKIEKGLVKKALSVKSLKKNDRKKKQDLIIFPYKVSKTVDHYTESEFNAAFPEGKKYLWQYRRELDKRNKEEKALWFEYGRSQAIGSVLQDKLIIPMVITRHLTVYEGKKEDIPYAGYFIVKQEDAELDLSVAKRILESKEFFEYVKSHGTPTAIESYRISATKIMDYRFSKSCL